MKIHQGNMLDTAVEVVTSMNRVIDKAEYKEGKIIYIYSGKEIYIFNFAGRKMEYLKTEINKN